MSVLLRIDIRENNAEMGNKTFVLMRQEIFKKGLNVNRVQSEREEREQVDVGRGTPTGHTKDAGLSRTSATSH